MSCWPHGDFPAGTWTARVDEALKPKRSIIAFLKSLRVAAMVLRDG